MSEAARKIEPAGGAKPFDVERVRADFPILFREVYGKPLVYLDNGASAQKPRSVIDAMEAAMTLDYANVHRGLHYLSNQSTAAFEKARSTVARYLNSPSDEQIIFTKNATEAINLVAYSFGALQINEGDEIVLSVMEHHSNIVPWHFHRERRGAVIKWAEIRDDGSFDLEGFERLLTPRTRIVAITQMSNVLGTVTPLKEIIRIAHERGIPVLVDGSQGAVHLKIDVQELDCDFYVCTGHKLYGPTGIGVLYAKRQALDLMPPFLGGGEMIEHVGRDRITYGVPPHRFEAGTPPIVEAIGLGAALTYIMGLNRDAIRLHEDMLTEYAHQRMAELNYVKIHGRAPGKGSIVAFSMDGLHPHDVSTIIDRSGVAIRAGHHCAQPLMERLGVTATCRASFAMYNTTAEVDALIDALRKAKDFLGEDDEMSEATELLEEGAAPLNPNAATVSGPALPPEELERLATDIVAALKTVFDPEIPSDIYELGLIYKVDIDDERNVAVEMTLTAPGCPVAGEMPIWVQNAISGVPGVKDVKVEIVFEPPWESSRMSEEARVALNMFY